MLLKTRSPTAWIRIIFFLACTGLGVWTFTDPIRAAEVITTLNVDGRQEDILQLQTLLLASNDTILVEAGTLLSDLSIDTLLTAFVRTFASLILIASGGIPNTAVLVAPVYLTATVFMVVTTVEDEFVILRDWFCILFIVLGCAIPTLVTTYEAVHSLRCS